MAEETKQPTQADTLRAIGKDLDVFTCDGKVYATVDVNGHVRTLEVINELHGTGGYVRSRFAAMRGGDIPRDGTIGSFIENVRARAIYDGQVEERQVFRRIGHDGQRGGKVYVDLGTPDHSVVEVEAHGWRVLERSPVPFLRSATTDALPMPVETRASFLPDIVSQHLLPHASGASVRLVTGFIVGAYHPFGPYPVLALAGREGCGKTTLARTLMRLIDPVRGGKPNTKYLSVDDLRVKAANTWLVTMDNLSSLNADLSDAMATISTGVAASKRKLWTDGTTYESVVMRPQLLTNIHHVIERPDLRSRAIMLNLPPLGEMALPEDTFEPIVENYAPRLFGAVLDAVAGALAEPERIDVRGMRMLDHVKFVSGAEDALGWGRGTYAATFDAHEQAKQDAIVQSTPFIDWLMRLVDESKDQRLEGTPEFLLTELERYVSAKNNHELQRLRKSTDIWPSNAAAFGRMWTTYQSAVERNGYVMAEYRAGNPSRTRIKTIEKAKSSVVMTPTQAGWVYDKRTQTWLDPTT